MRWVDSRPGWISSFTLTKWASVIFRPVLKIAGIIWTMKHSHLKLPLLRFVRCVMWLLARCRVMNTIFLHRESITWLSHAGPPKMFWTPWGELHHLRSCTASSVTRGKKRPGSREVRINTRYNSLKALFWEREKQLQSCIQQCALGKRPCLRLRQCKVVGRASEKHIWANGREMITALRQDALLDQNDCAAVWEHFICTVDTDVLIYQGCCWMPSWGISPGL